MIHVILLGFLITYFLLNYLIFDGKRKQLGSDHFFHLKLILSIKNNNNKFVKKLDYLTIHTPIYYPQLYHYFLSFFSEKVINTRAHIFNYIFNLLTFITTYYFIYYFFNDHLVFVDKKHSMILFSIFYITTPFYYVFWNAKNTGISARSFGLFLGQTYFILLYLFINTSNPFLVIGLIFLSSIAWFGSNFAFQAILFISLLLIPFYMSKVVFILIPPIVGFFVWFLISPQTAKVYYTELFRLKKNYFKYLICISKMNERFSIWRDWVYDFWIILKTKPLKKSFNYIYTNSIFSLIGGFPLIVFHLFFLSKSSFQDINNNIVIATFSIFILTSFRFLRFLGQPERYLEFIVPFNVLFIIANVKNPFIFYILAVQVIIFLVIVFITILQRYQASLNIKDKNFVAQISNFLTPYQNSAPINILTNSDFVSITLFPLTNVKFVLALISREYTLGLHINNIYLNNYVYKKEALSYFSNLGIVDFLIIRSPDQTKIVEYIMSNQNISISAKLVMQNDEFTILQFSKENTLVETKNINSLS